MLAGKPVPVARPTEEILWNNENLLLINASSVPKYGRKIGQKLWTDSEISSHMISPKKQPGAHCRPKFDERRKLIWEGASKSFT